MDISYKFLKLDLHTVFTYLIPPINTRFPLLEVVKLLVCRQATSHRTVSIDENIFVRLLFEGDAYRVTSHISHGGLTTTAGHFEKII